MRRRHLVAAAGAALAAPALAQAPFPDRPIRMIVPIPPGGAPDVAARIVAQRAQDRLGQPIIVENRSGSNGNIAAEAVAKARADGYTLLFGQDSLITVNPALYDRMPVDVRTELVPVVSAVRNQFVMAVNPSIPARTLAEFVAFARRADPPLAFASGGIGSQHQLAMELLMRRAGFRMLHVPYRGGAPAATATVSGETAAMFSGTSLAPLVREGRLRALATTGAGRAAAFPELPTIAETYPGYEVTIWLGIFAPAGVPAPVMARLRDGINATLGEPWVRERLEAAGGLEPFVTTPDEFAALIAHDAEKYGTLVREIGLKAE